MTKTIRGDIPSTTNGETGRSTPEATFDASRTGRGTKEWAEIGLNIQRGCSHVCVYCYSAHNAVVRFKTCAPQGWGTEVLTKNASMTSYPRKRGVVMYPTAHDIVPFNLEESIRVLKVVLGSGNQVLIVSKPHLECITKMVDELAPWKDKIMFRFSVGSMSEAVCKLWEPGAPAPAERIAALQVAWAAGYRTSISAEPLLGGLETAQAILAAVRPYVTDSVWVGKMNKIGPRVDKAIPGIAEAVVAIETAQSDPMIVTLYTSLNSDPLVRWKDSIQDVLQRAR